MAAALSYRTSQVCVKPDDPCYPVCENDPKSILYNEFTWKISGEFHIFIIHLNSCFDADAEQKEKTNVSLSEISDSLLLTTALISFVQTLECKLKTNSS